MSAPEMAILPSGLVLPHHCNPTAGMPNGRIVIHEDTNGFDVVATRDIGVDELISFNYLSTEYDMSAPFTCLCGDARCFGEIRGYKHVPVSRRTDIAATSSLLLINRSLPVTRAVSLGDVIASDITKVDVESEPGMAILPSGLVLPHHCNPTAGIINGRVVALSDMKPGEQLTVNVGVLRCDLPAPFQCHCGFRSCPGKIAGFGHLSADEQDRLMFLVEPDVRLQAAESGRIVVRSSATHVRIAVNGGMGLACFASSGIRAGDRVFADVTGLALPFPTLYTICTAPGKHVLFVGGSQCMAHACMPNGRIVIHEDTNGFDVVATRDIGVDELISFNYLSTEYDMSAPFTCLCGDARCFGEIRGYKHVPVSRRTDIAATSSLLLINRSLPVTRAVSLGDVIASDITKVDVESEPGMAILPSGLVLPHHCNPTAGIINGRVVALSDMKPGEQLTVNVGVLRCDLPAPFQCHCGFRSCPGKIAGFGHLSADEQDRLMFLVEPDVRLQAAESGRIVVRSSAPHVSIDD